MEDGAGFGYRLGADGALSAWDLSGSTPVLVGETSVWALLELDGCGGGGGAQAKPCNA